MAVAPMVATRRQCQQGHACAARTPCPDYMSRSSQGAHLHGHRHAGLVPQDILCLQACKVHVPADVVAVSVLGLQHDPCTLQPTHRCSILHLHDITAWPVSAPQHAPYMHIYTYLLARYIRRSDAPAHEQGTDATQPSGRALHHTVCACDLERCLVA